MFKCEENEENEIGYLLNCVLKLKIYSLSFSERSHITYH